jgi:hypothetical protein
MGGAETRTEFFSGKKIYPRKWFLKRILPSSFELKRPLALQFGHLISIGLSSVGTSMGVLHLEQLTTVFISADS